MIQSKKELLYYIRQDKIANGKNEVSFASWLKNIFAPDLIMKYLVLLRKTEYYCNVGNKSVIFKIKSYIYRYRLHNLGIRLGYSIPINVFGAGLSLPHSGTIVVSVNAKVGEFCRLHVGVNIGASGGNPHAPIIGNNVYIGPGAILFGEIKIADNVTIGANATVNKDCDKTNVVLAGTPAKIVKEDYPNWITFNKVI